MKSGSTQTELAIRIGTDQSQISRWERGIQPVPIWVGKLLECLGNIEQGENDND